MEHCEGIGRDRGPGSGGTKCRREGLGLCLDSEPWKDSHF